MNVMVCCLLYPQHQHCGTYGPNISQDLSACNHACGAPHSRSHLAISDEDPSVGDKFSTSRFAGQGASKAVPASAHGAPSTVQESREALSRLKRMQGFESQDFDAVVRGTRAGKYVGIGGGDDAANGACCVELYMSCAASIPGCPRIPTHHVRKTMWSGRCRFIAACMITTWQNSGNGQWQPP